MKTGTAFSLAGHGIFDDLAVTMPRMDEMIDTRVNGTDEWG